jgi:hypothetical protein
VGGALVPPACRGCPWCGWARWSRVRMKMSQ